MITKTGIKCEYCGRFIGYAEFGRDEIGIDYTPETEYTTERIDHYHKKCRTKTK